MKNLNLVYFHTIIDRLFQLMTAHLNLTLLNYSNSCLARQFNSVLESDIWNVERCSEHKHLSADEEQVAESLIVLDNDRSQRFHRWCLTSALLLSPCSIELLVIEFHLTISTLGLILSPWELILIVAQTNHRWDLTVDLAEQWNRIEAVLAVDAEDWDVTDLVGNHQLV